MEEKMPRIMSWEVSDAFWERVQPLLPVPARDPDRQYRRKPGGGRKPLNFRRVFEGIVYVLRTSIQWKALLKERFGSPSSIHAYFQRWERAGVFRAMWQAGLAEYDEMAGISWQWQSIDGAMGKAPLAREAVGPNPTDRGKNESKRHLLVEERGVPLSLVVTDARRHDVTQLEAVLDALVIERPKVTQKKPQHHCADYAYTGEPARQAMPNRNYTPHVRPRGEEARSKKRVPGFRARRWVVEACHSWFNRFRKLNPRYEKTLASHMALLHLAAAIICWRKIGVYYG